MMPVIGDAIAGAVGSLVDGAIGVVKKLVIDRDAQLKAEAELRLLGVAAEQELRRQEHDEKMGQIEINKIEAGSSDPYVRRARPTIMWICALALAYSFLAHPALQWIGAIWYPYVTYPELPNVEYLFMLMGTMLGFGGFRTYEKMKGVT